MEKLTVIKPGVFHQAHLLGLERERIQLVAAQLRKSIDRAAGLWPDVPTAGVVCNLIAVVDAWETNQIEQINEQVRAL